jgi:spermidine synthase
LVCFFFSGIAGLIYEVVWTRRLTLIFGTTLHSASTVLAIFMAGLALGSMIFGRLADRIKKPLHLYALLEVAIGIYALLTPALFGQLSVLRISQGNLEGVQGVTWITVVMVAAVLLVPTVLMGGTLPVVAKFLIRRREVVGTKVAQLYALNTFGGAVGALLAGYILIASLGISLTIYSAAFINIAVGFVTWWLQRDTTGEQTWDEVDVERQPLRKKRGKRKRSELHARGSTQLSILLVGVGLSGLAALSLEVSWTRALTLVLGSSVYAFSTILTAFLLGIALGSWIAPRVMERGADPWRQLAFIELLLGGSVILLNIVFDRMPLWFLSLYQMAEGSFWGMQWLELALVLLVLLVPTTLMGTTFPLAARVYANDLERLGRSIGSLYFSNTVGATLGPLLTGFLLIPKIGMQTSILLAGMLYMLVGTAFVGVDKGLRSSVKVLAGGLLLGGLALGILLPRWDTELLTSGVYVYADTYDLDQDTDELRDAMVTGEQIFYREGLTATVTVRRSGESLTLQINGKTDAGTNLDLGTELILGHLPMLLHPHPEQVLVVGLGSGITLGAVEQYSVESIDVVEIEAAVVEAAGYFSEVNHAALDDPRLRLFVDDARNYVLATQSQYDVITAEPSNPWIRGVSNLFTREQYQAYKERLKPGGIMFQWAHIYSMSEQDIKTVIGTFQSVFPHTTVWQNLYAGDIFLLGTEEELSIDFERLVEELRRPEIQSDLGRTNLEDPYRLLSQFVMDEGSIRSYTQGASIHTDDRPILEFSAPKYLFGYTTSENLKGMEAFRANVFPFLYNFAGVEAGGAAVQDVLQSYQSSWVHIVQGEIEADKEEYEMAIAEFEAALSFDPSNGTVKNNLAWIHQIQAKTFFESGEYENALQELLDVLKMFPERALVHRDVSNIYIVLGRYEEAIEHLETAVRLDPLDLDAKVKLGVLYGNAGMITLSEQLFQEIIEQDPRSIAAHNNLATLYQMTDRFSEAIRELEISLSIDSDQPDIRGQLARLQAEGP